MPSTASHCSRDRPRRRCGQSSDIGVRVTEGELVPPAEALLDKALEAPVPLHNIPEGLRLRSVTTTADGIEARFTGKSVTFRPSSTSA
ncbi:hypothetical protein [Streptomyces bicolor]|uniref:hypothetical protein n=1 Tax=Streptomyces bicolor TaxID=66874 RepID=UPI0004E1E811